MGDTEVAKFQTVWAPVLNKHFFKLRNPVASEDPKRFEILIFAVSVTPITF